MIKSPAKSQFQYEILLKDGRKFKSAIYNDLKLCEKHYAAQKKLLTNKLQHRTWDKPNGNRTENV